MIKAPRARTDMYFPPFKLVARFKPDENFPVKVRSDGIAANFEGLTIQKFTQLGEVIKFKASFV